MRRLGLVDRVGYSLYALHGMAAVGGEEAFRPRRQQGAGDGVPRAATLALSAKIRRALSEPSRSSDLAVRIGEPRDAVKTVLERMWLSGVVTGSERAGFELVVHGKRRAMLCDRILEALAEPGTAAEIAERLDITLPVARRRLQQLRNEGVVTVRNRSLFVRTDRHPEIPAEGKEAAQGSFARMLDSLST